jgi:hypothetical protein
MEQQHTIENQKNRKIKTKNHFLLRVIGIILLLLSLNPLNNLRKINYAIYGSSFSLLFFGSELLVTMCYGLGCIGMSLRWNQRLVSTFLIIGSFGIFLFFMAFAFLFTSFR